MSITAKAKTAKLSSLISAPLLGKGLTCIRLTVRTLIDCFSEIPASEKIQADVLQDNIEWAKKEKRIFLKQSLEARLIALCVHLSTVLMDTYNPITAMLIPKAINRHFPSLMPC